MTFSRLAPRVALPVLFVAGLGALSAAVVSGSSAERHKTLRITKECSQYTGAAGSFCTITSSNVAAIKIGSKVFYDQAAGVPAGLLDSNVVLDAGHSNRALGRCTLDGTTNIGLCTFSDGTGRLAGFHARIDVDCTDGCRWDGTYGFKPESDR